MGCRRRRWFRAKLLDGCRIGRGARVRSAVIGAAAVVGEGEQIGYAVRGRG
jgi:ADP-glucose pyrophosphorylase